VLIILGCARWYRNKKPEDPAPKGFVGFMDGGTRLSYVESSEDRKKYLPYISDKTVKEVNKYGSEHPEVFKKKEEK
jgi:hypothetical protein